MNYKENAEVVKQYLDKNEVHYMMEDRGNVMVYTGPLGMKKGIFSSYQFRLYAEDDVIQIFVNLPISANEKTVEVAEFVARVNFSLKRGKMDVDCNDGEVRFHLCVPVAAMQADSDDTLQDMFLIPMLVLTKYAKGVADIVFTGVDAKTAYERCEE